MVTWALLRSPRILVPRMVVLAGVLVGDYRHGCVVLQETGGAFGGTRPVPRPSPSAHALSGAQLPPQPLWHHRLQAPSPVPLQVLILQLYK